MKKQTWEDKLEEHYRNGRFDIGTMRSFIFITLSDHDRELVEGLEGMKKKQLYQVRDLWGKVTITESSKVFDSIMGDCGSVQEVHNQALLSAQEFIKKGII